MTAEQLAELKEAWPGDWQADGDGYELTVAPGRTVAAFCGQGDPVVWTERGWREHFRSARRLKTFTEAVASFRAEAEKVARVYAALAGRDLT